MKHGSTAMILYAVYENQTIMKLCSVKLIISIHFLPLLSQHTQLVLFASEKMSMLHHILQNWVALCSDGIKN